MHLVIVVSILKLTSLKLIYLIIVPKTDPKVIVSKHTYNLHNVSKYYLLSGKQKMEIIHTIVV